MKDFIALCVATLAVAAQAGYAPSAWPVSTYGVDSWNGWNGYNSWNGLNSWSYPYGVNQWSSAAAWPAVTYSNDYNGWYGHGKTVAKVNPWGLPLATSSYGYGYNNYLGAIPAAKYVNPGSVHVAPLVGHAGYQKLIVA